LTFKPAPGKINHTQAKAYSPITLSFMQKNAKTGYQDHEGWNTGKLYLHV